MTISPHASRWVVAAVAAPIILWILFWPRRYFSSALWPVRRVGLVRIFTVVFGPDAPKSLLLVGVGGWLLIAAGAFWHGAIGQIGGLFFAVAAGMLYFVFRYEQIAFITNQAGRFALGHAYLSLFFSCLIPVFLADHGQAGYCSPCW